MGALTVDTKSECTYICRVRIEQLLPVLRWGREYDSADLQPDVAAGVTIAAMLVPQAMAYALLAGLPPEVGLYAATAPVLVYAVFGTSRQLAVGPVAIVSLLTASALAPLVEEGTSGYLAAAAMLALMVGFVHVVLGLARLGFLVNLLSHAVLVGFTAAAAIIIGFSQVKHILGISIEGKPHFHETVAEVIGGLGGTHAPTLAVGVASIAVLFGFQRLAPRLPGALLVVVSSIVAVEVFGLAASGVAVVGDIPDALPAFGLPELNGGLMADLVVTALVITLVGFMESIAVAKVYARRHRDPLDANQELIGLGAANLASGLFGGYPVTGGFSRTAVNDAAGARTPLASVVTALLVLVTIAFLTPLLSSLPNAALGAIIISAVVGLVDVAEMRHIAKVKRSDLVGLGVAFVATLALGIELGIGVAVVASMLVVFARMSTPHRAELGQVPGTTTFRNIDRFDEVETFEDIRVVRIDAALSFVNAANIKAYLLGVAADLAGDDLAGGQPALVLDASGIGDIDATGADMLHELLAEMDEREVVMHLADVKGPARDVLLRAGLWDEFPGRIHPSTHDAVAVARGLQPAAACLRESGVDERPRTSEAPKRSSDHTRSREIDRSQNHPTHNPPHETDSPQTRQTRPYTPSAADTGAGGT